jgi:GT2 family glycosyltransferase
MIREVWPESHLLPGDGDLYWCGGMRLAWANAEGTAPDFFMWLNDDVELLPTAVRVLHGVWFRAAESGRRDTIVVGSCIDPDRGKFTYGGQKRTGRHPGRLTPVIPTARSQECDTFDGNCVLVPREVYLRVGILGGFRHAIGDHDYGYRARQSGCRLEVAPEYVGTCRRNVDRESRRTYSTWKELVGPKGLPPRDWAVFLYRHAGAEWPVYWIGTYIKWLATSGVRSLGIRRSVAKRVEGE